VQQKEEAFVTYSEKKNEKKRNETGTCDGTYETGYGTVQYGTTVV